MPCSWEGNCRSGHASDISVLYLWAQGLEEGDEHPPMLSCGAWSTLPFFFPETGSQTACHVTLWVAGVRLFYSPDALPVSQSTVPKALNGYSGLRSWMLISQSAVYITTEHTSWNQCHSSPLNFV